MAIASPKDLPSAQGALETNLARKGLYSLRPTRDRQAFEATDLLGLLRASGLLRTDPDLDVLIWLTEAFRVRGSEEGIVSFTLYELAHALYGRPPCGSDRGRLKESLRRLRGTTIDLVGYDAIRKRTDARVASVETILETLTSQLDEIDDGSGGEAGALRGNTFTIQFRSWMIDSLRCGYVTYYRLSILRRLKGLAKRLWVYLEAERYKRIGEGQEATWIKLGELAYTSFGMHYCQERQARAALKRAGKAIVAVDPRFESVTVEPRPGGHAIIAVRTGRDIEQGLVRRQILESLSA